MATAAEATVAPYASSGATGGLAIPDSDSDSDGESLQSNAEALHFHDDHTHKAWDIKSTIAFWISAWTVEGAVLFTLGSAFLYPGMVPD